MKFKIKNRKKFIVITLLVLILVVFLFYRFRHLTPEANVEAVWVRAAQVKETTLPREAHAIGTLVARSVEITPEFSGHVEKILFRDGAFVKEGEALVQLDNAVYKAKYASAKAKLIYSENNFKRMALLGKRGAISKQAIDQADADLKERKADADESEVILQKTTLTAPFDGVVGKCKINIGDYVTVGQSLVTLTDTQHLRIEYNLPEKTISQLKIGQDISVKTAAYPQQSFAGKLSFVSPTVNSDSRSISLYADIPNDKNLLAAGMFVDVTHSLGSDEKALMVPERSLVPILDGQQIYKIVDGKAYAVTAVIGKRLGSNVQILEGLSMGDTIVTDGQMKLKNGIAVRVKT